MKVILTGVTGFLGEEVVRQCVAHPQITEIVALARRELKDEFKEEKKITWIKTEDFGLYTEDQIEKLKGADGCIWTLGTVPGKVTPEADYLRRVNVDWTIDAAKTFATKLSQPEGKKFMFIYTSGFAMPDPDKLDQKLWFAEDLRKLRAQGDKGILELAKDGLLTSIVCKPAFITEHDPILSRLTLGIASVSRQALAASYIDMLVNGHDSGIVRNGDAKKHGDEVLRKQKLASAK